MSRILSGLVQVLAAARWVAGRLARGRVIVKAWIATPYVRALAQSLPERRRAEVEEQVAELVGRGRQRFEALRIVAENAANLAREHGRRGYRRMMLEDLEAVAYLSVQMAQEKRKT